MWIIAWICLWIAAVIALLRYYESQPLFRNLPTLKTYFFSCFQPNSPLKGHLVLRRPKGLLVSCFPGLSVFLHLVCCPSPKPAVVCLLPSSLCRN